MKSAAVAGGLYRERCAWPQWDHLYGSGGRAAAALSGHSESTTLHTYASASAITEFSSYADAYEIKIVPHDTAQIVSFGYVHCMSVPVVQPSQVRMRLNEPFAVEDEIVLRFGMLEGSARVVANRCVYDPQSAFAPQQFADNGSKAAHLAIVGNRMEIMALGGEDDLERSAMSLLRTSGADVVIAKAGAHGAVLVQADGVHRIAAFRSDNVWTIGSGDVFAAAFTAAWGLNESSATDAARIASIAVSEYAGSMALPIRAIGDLAVARPQEVVTERGEVYLAGPFFDMARLWMVEEARKCLRAVGMTVFSPVHDVGHGAADDVVAKDIAAINRCDIVFALLDGNDTGTLFEVGHARAKGKPVYALAQSVAPEDLKMVEGSGCRIFSDLVTAVHHAAWRT